MACIRRLFLAIVYLTAFSCKPMQDTSDLQSLDNLAAGGKFRDNQCRAAQSVSDVQIQSQPAYGTIIPPIGKEASGQSDRLKRVAGETLTSVPQNLQRLFAHLGGKITIIDTATKVCSGFFKDEGGNPLFLEVNDMTSCAVFFPESPQNKRVLNIIVDPDPRFIRHGILRSFSALLTEYFPKLQKVGNGYRYAPENIADRQIKRDLAKLFLEDIFVGESTDYKEIIFAFGNKGIIELVDALEKRDYSNGDDLFKQVSFRESSEEKITEENRLERENRMLNLITADAFDSYYCNNWDRRNLNVIVDVKTGRAPLTALSQTYNTKEIFRQIFPTSHTFFQERMITWMNQVVGRLLPGGYGLVGSRLSASVETPISVAEGLALQGHRRRSSRSSSRSSGYESPWWAGTKAFFGSVWDNTGGAASRGYQAYSRNVRAAVDEVYDGNVASTTAKAIGKVGRDAYSDYYDTQYQKTEDRIRVLQQGGMTEGQSQAYAVGLAVGDITGFTDAAEAVGGADTAEGRILSTGERWQRGVSSVPKIAGTMAGAVGTTQRLASGTSRTLSKLCLGPCDKVYATNGEAVKAAKKLGYKKTNYRSSSQTVMKKTKQADRGAPDYITRDIDQHSGGAFKGAKSPEALGSKTTRCGTYDSCLNRIAD